MRLNRINVYSYVLNYQVVQVYMSWTKTDIAPMRQLVGVERVSLISPSKSADVSHCITACT